MTTSVTQPGFREVEPVEVIDGHRSRRRIYPGVWPRLNPASDLPHYMRVSVRVPGGIFVKVQVNLRTDGTFVYANADPAGRCRGEDPDASAAFPVESEIEAERLALLNL